MLSKLKMKKNRPYNKKHIKCVETRGKNADRQPANGMNTIPTRLQTNTDVNIFINTFRMQTLALSPKTYNIKSKGPNCATRSETFSVTQTDCNHFHSAESETWRKQPSRWRWPQKADKNIDTLKKFFTTAAKNRANWTDGETDVPDKWEQRAERRGFAFYKIKWV